MCVPRYAQRYYEIVHKRLRDIKENDTSVYDMAGPEMLTKRVDSRPETRSGLAGGPPGAIASARGSAPPLGYSLPGATATPPRIPRGVSRFEGIPCC